MHTKAFGLKRSPFSVEIEPHAMYQNESFHQGEMRLKQGLKERGMMVLTGQPGMGKTSLVRSLIHQLANSLFLPLYVAISSERNPMRHAVESLLLQMGEKSPFNNTAKGVAVLQEALLKSYNKDRLPVIVIDDAHSLDERDWMLLKSLINCNMDSCLTNCLIAVGATENIIRTLTLNRMEEVRQRLQFCFRLTGLAQDEIEAYLAARLKWAGSERPLFPREIALEIHRYSNGAPRVVNQLAHACLIAAAFDQRELVDTPCLEKAKSEIELKRK